MWEHGPRRPAHARGGQEGTHGGAVPGLRGERAAPLGPLSLGGQGIQPRSIQHDSQLHHHPQSRYNQAKLSLHDRTLKVAAVVESLEREMELLCLTGVEDQLQADVRPTLEMLRNAGIKVRPGSGPLNQVPCPPGVVPWNSVPCPPKVVPWNSNKT